MSHTAKYKESDKLKQNIGGKSHHAQPRDMKAFCNDKGANHV